MKAQKFSITDILQKDSHAKKADDIFVSSDGKPIFYLLFCKQTKQFGLNDDELPQIS